MREKRFFSCLVFNTGRGSSADGIFEANQDCSVMGRHWILSSEYNIWEIFHRRMDANTVILLSSHDNAVENTRIKIGLHVSDQFSFPTYV